MTWVIVLIIVVILIGIAGIATGVCELIERDTGCGILGIFLGAIILFINVILIFSVIGDNTETTKKVIGKGTIVTEVDFNYSNGDEEFDYRIEEFSMA